MILSSTGLLLTGALGQHAAAQGTAPFPFVRGATPQSLPSLTPLPQTAPNPAAPSPARAPSLTPPAQGSSLPRLNAPRSHSEGSQTKVVYDLPAGAGYTLTPSFGGLRVEFRGVQASPAAATPLGTSVSDYRVSATPGGAQLMFSTPFTLGVSSGWRASEATIAAGTRVLILEFGPALSGGAAPSVRGAVQLSQAVTPPPTPPAALVLTPPGLGSGQAANADLMPNRSAALQSAADQLPPGDSAGGSSQAALPAPAAGLPGAVDSDPNVLSGKAGGPAQVGALLTEPRIGKNPGVTRVVLDLPPGTRFQISPGALGLSIELSGVGAAEQLVGQVSSELRGWRYSAGTERTTVFLISSSPLGLHSGWRSVFLPPMPGSERSRLAIDLSPAFSNTTPLLPAERVLATVPPVRSAALTFSGVALVTPSVVINPGHGGRDPGAVGIVTEKAVVMDVALRVRQYLQSAGVNVILSREGDRELYADKNTDLNARAALGYGGAQLFVSIHANSMVPANVLKGYGIETWWNNNNAASATFASLLQSNLMQTTGAFNQGLKSSRSLAVLRGSRVPAALVEIGFVGHPVNGGNLQDNNYLERVALGIARGIREALVTGVGSK